MCCFAVLLLGYCPLSMGALQVILVRSQGVHAVLGGMLGGLGARVCPPSLQGRVCGDHG